MTDDRPRYEYETYDITGKSQEAITRLLQVWGDDGYRLVAIHDHYIIMEREK